MEILKGLSVGLQPFTEQMLSFEMLLSASNFHDLSNKFDQKYVYILSFLASCQNVSAMQMATVSL
jgi:hypothetical protein